MQVLPFLSILFLHHPQYYNLLSCRLSWSESILVGGNFSYVPQYCFNQYSASFIVWLINLIPLQLLHSIMLPFPLYIGTNLLLKKPMTHNSNMLAYLAIRLLLSSSILILFILLLFLLILILLLQLLLSKLI